MLNKIIINSLPYIPKGIVQIFANRYIAGPNLNDAVNLSNELHKKEGAWTTIDVLGEFVQSRERALTEKEHSSEVLDAIVENKLNTYLSLKPTSLGLGINEDFAYDNISEIVSKAYENNIFVRLDMENTPYTSKTLNLYKKLREQGLDNVGIVIQAYLRRSETDIRSLLEYKPSIRLCKGIYVEDIKHAIKDPQEIRENYKRLLRLIFDNDMYPGIATHDEELIQDALSLIEENKIDKEKYEFQMLLGVREQRRKEILDAGHNLRVYVPFGEDWYGYSIRRLKENPNMAIHIAKSIVFGEK